MRILIIEDEVHLAEALRQILEENRYKVDLVHDGADGLDYGLSGQYDVILLDVMLPRLDGLTLLQHLRAAQIQTPVLILTARSHVEDRVAGLDCGADDYLTKPFDSRELLARIRALSRRQGQVQLHTLTFSDLTLGLSDRFLHCGPKSVHLGYKEFEVLRLLMTNPRIVLSKEELISKVWGLASNAEDNNVEAYISFLRKKFHFLGSGVNIVTVRKVGYRLEETS